MASSIFDECFNQFPPLTCSCRNSFFCLSLSTWMSGKKIRSLTTSFGSLAWASARPNGLNPFAFLMVMEKLMKI